MSHPVVDRRRAEQRRRIEIASEWAGRLADRLDISAVVVFGSSACGDFNKWSDIDVLVVSPALPSSARERLKTLMADAPPGLQPVGWTPSELINRRARRDPIAIECDDVGQIVLGSLQV